MTAPSRTGRDVELMAGIARRDADALAKLYDHHAGLVMGLCMRVLRDPAEAEEVVADVFFELWDRADRYDAERASPVVYLMNLTRSRAIDRLRRVRRRPVPGGDAESTGRAAVPGENPPPATPLEGAVEGERRRIMRKALASLDPAARRLLELSYFEGLSHSEIAALEDTPIGTVKTRIRQGVLRLRDALGDLEDRP